MGKRIVGYVISHSGKPGGPWEADVDHCVGFSTDHETRPPRGVWDGPDVGGWLARVRESHPNAKVFRLVRRERHRAEEAAVVEAAMAWEAADAALCKNRNEAQEDNLATVECSTRYKALQTCAALRAKRGG